MVRLRTAALTALASAAIASIALAEGPFDLFQVELQGVCPFTNQDPWMADVWGYETGARSFALACQGNALRVIEVTNPASPVTVSFVPSIGTDLKDCKTYGHYAYCVNQNGLMQVVDLANPLAAVTVNQIGDFSGSHNCFVERNRGLLFVCGHRNTEGFEVYDLNVNPVSPPLVAHYGNDYCHDVNVRGGLALVCAIADGYFELVDVSNLANIQRISTFTHPGPLAPHSGWFSNDLRYVFTGDEASGGHLIAWDITNQKAPLPVASYEAGSGASIHNVHVQGNYAYLSYYSEGVRIIDVSDPPNMHEVGHIDSPLFDDNHCFMHPVFKGVWGVYPHTTAGNFYFGNMCGGGVYVARFLGPASGVADDDGDAPAGQVRLFPSAPNPFAAATRIPFALAAPGTAELRIVDLTGRVVTTLGAGDFGAGRHEVTWDGRDASGRSVPAGVYWVQLEGAGQRDVSRVVRAR